MRFGYDHENKRLMIVSECDADVAQIVGVHHMMNNFKASHTFQINHAENIWGEMQQQAILGVQATEQVIIVPPNADADNAAREIAKKTFGPLYENKETETGGDNNGEKSNGS